jgi:hypothetical protein
MAFPRGRKSKHKRRPDANPRTFSQKSKAEDTEEDSQQEDGEKDEHIDSSDAGNTQLQLDRQSILEFCRKRQAKKQTLKCSRFSFPDLRAHRDGLLSRGRSGRG